MYNLRSKFSAFEGRRILVTGHTGFKGSWLSLWLEYLGAEVTGLALDPHTDPNLFTEASVADHLDDRRTDIRDFEGLNRMVRETRPDVVFHLAAQPLVRLSYAQARETFETNCMGSVHVFEAVRRLDAPCVLVHVGTDKCYLNLDTGRAYEENDPLGGLDPYSGSKAAAEVAFGSYAASFFKGEQVHAASGRAGNVIGGGDWALDRIVPDCVRALGEGRPVPVRNPRATRPWQHVLEALSGYLLLGAEMLGGNPVAEGSWNFGPPPESVKTVSDLVEAVIAVWGEGSWEHTREADAVHEANFLSLSCQKAHGELDWCPRWDFTRTAERTAGWYRRYAEGVPARDLCLSDIEDYMAP